MNKIMIQMGAQYYYNLIQSLIKELHNTKDIMQKIGITELTFPEHSLSIIEMQYYYNLSVSNKYYMDVHKDGSTYTISGNKVDIFGTDEDLIDLYWHHIDKTEFNITNDITKKDKKYYSNSLETEEMRFQLSTVYSDTELFFIELMDLLHKNQVQPFYLTLDQAEHCYNALQIVKPKIKERCEELSLNLKRSLFR